MARAAALLLVLTAASGCQPTSVVLHSQGLEPHVALGRRSGEAPEVCQAEVCRPVRVLRLGVGKGRMVDRRHPALPYVYDDAVYVVPGDDFSVTGDIEGDRLVKLRLVRPGEKPPHVLNIRFGQVGDPRDEPVMMLLVDSKLPRGLQYQATILPLGGAAQEPTSTCPVRAQVGASEMWPFAIELLVMRELRLYQPTEHQGRCP